MTVEQTTTNVFNNEGRLVGVQTVVTVTFDSAEEANRKLSYRGRPVFMGDDLEE